MKQRHVVFLSNQKSLFGQVPLSKNSTALVMDKDVHERALKAADAKLTKTLQSIRNAVRQKALDDAGR